MVVSFVLVVTGCNGLADDLFCSDQGCGFNTREWGRITALSPLPSPPPDRSNKYADNEAAVSLGHRLYYDTRLSGRATLQDTLGRPIHQARAPLNQFINVSCATCHDPARGGGDHTSVPGHVSVGAGWYDVNGQQTLNAAHYPLLYWNGRTDSLWAQAAAVMESSVSMNGDRVAITRTILEHYRTEYQAVFGGDPVPALPTGEEAENLRKVLRRPETGTGPCTGTPPACPAGCQTKTDHTGLAACWPTLPLHGKAGRDPTRCTLGGPGVAPVGEAPFPKEPFDDQFDCLDPAARDAINKVWINVSKAIAAYERKLVSRNSAFDRFVAEGAEASPPAISETAQRGLKLFVGKASCIDCHSGPLLSDGGFHNIGVPQTGAGVPSEIECRVPRFCDCARTDKNAESCLPWGFEDGLAKLKAGSLLRRDGVFSDDPTAGTTSHGAFYKMAASDQRRGAWRTPSLRDVAITGPYMHTGVYRTLEEVVWHYDQGGEIGEGGLKAPELKPLFLSARERSDLVAFLKTLTGRPDPGSERLYTPPLDPLATPPEPPMPATAVSSPAVAP